MSHFLFRCPPSPSPSPGSPRSSNSYNHKFRHTFLLPTSLSLFFFHFYPPFPPLGKNKSFLANFTSHCLFFLFTSPPPLTPSTYPHKISLSLFSSPLHRQGISVSKVRVPPHSRIFFLSRLVSSPINLLSCSAVQRQMTTRLLFTPQVPPRTLHSQFSRL